MVSKQKPLHKKMLFIKTFIITVLAASVVAFSNGPVVSASASKLTTIHYVYLNDQYIGIVSDKDIVEKLITEKAAEMKKTYNGVNLQVEPKVKYITEQVFNSTANNQEALNSLESAIELQANAAALVVDGNPVAYLDSQNTAEEVLKKMKLKYVTEAQLTEIEARKAAGNATLPELTENQSRLLDVQFSKNVTVEGVSISPNQIISADNAFTLLQKGTLEEKKYVVKEGDVLGTVANSNGLKLAELLKLNPELNENSVLQIGQELNITALKPYLEVIVEKEENLKESVPFKTEVKYDPALPKGETREKQQGKNGLRSVTYHTYEQNGVLVKKEATSAQMITQPVNHIVIKGSKVIPSRGEGTFAWPTSGGYISSQMGYRWGAMHKGIDIARPSNRTIKAADNGVVIFAGWSGSLGNKVIIDHNNGYQTVYGHMSSISVRVGQTVPKGSKLGIMGSTGDSTGVHLHFEIYKNGNLKNPLSYLR